MTIHDNGKISVTGEIFDSYGTHGFKGFLDTGCTHMLCIDQNLADAVCAPIVEETTSSIGGGSASSRGFVRLVDVRFGNMAMKGVRAFVPEKPISRSLIGISLLQSMNAVLVIDFGGGGTKGAYLSNEEMPSRMIGKVLHYFLVHKKILVGIDACEFC